MNDDSHANDGPAGHHLKYPPFVLLGSNVVIENPTAQDVLEALSSIEKPRQWCVAWLPTPESMEISVNSLGEYRLEYVNSEVHLSQIGLSAAQVRQCLCDFVQGNDNWKGRIDLKPDEQNHLMNRPIAFVDGKFYIPLWDGGFDIVDEQTQRRLMRATFRNEAIVAILASPFVLLLVWGLLSCHVAFKPNRHDAWLLVIVFIAIFFAIHWLNWRCPLCRKRLGIYPISRCLCSRKFGGSHPG